MAPAQLFCETLKKLEISEGLCSPAKWNSAQFGDDKLCWYFSRFVSHFPSSIKLNAIKFDIIDNSHSLQSSAVNIVSPLHLTMQRHQLHGGHAQGRGRPRLCRQVHAGRRVRPREDVQVCDDDDDLTWHVCTLYRSGLGLSLRADILSLDPGALSLMSGLSGLDGVSLYSLEALQRLKGPHDSHGPPPLIRPDPTHPPSNVRTMATKERDKNF